MSTAWGKDPITTATGLDVARTLCMHLDHLPLQLIQVHVVDRILRVGGRGECDECEATVLVF